MALAGCSLVLDGDRFLDAAPRDAADAAGPRDAGPRDAGPHDGGDAGPTDAGPDAEVVIEPPAPTRWQVGTNVRARDAIALGDGYLVVGSIVPEADRQGLLVYVDAAGTVDAWDVGSPMADQFTSAASRSGQTVVGGLTRGFSGTPNDQVFLVEVSPDGVQRAVRWGTPAEDALWDVSPGGSLGEWVGVGYHGTVGDRNGLVVVFDADLEPLWAAHIDAGEDDELFSATVIDGVLYAVGSTGNPDGGDTHSWVVALNASEVLWSRKSAMRTAGGVHLSPAVEGGLRMAGSIRGGRAALVQLSVDGEVSGFELPSVPGRMTRTWTSGADTFFTAGTFSSGSFELRVGRLSDERVLTRAIDRRIKTTGFLRTPLVSVGGQARLIGETPDGFVDIPFSTTLGVGCEAGSAMGSVDPITEADMPTTSVIRESLNLTGGPVVGLDIIDRNPLRADPACGADME